MTQQPHSDTYLARSMGGTSLQDIYKDLLSGKGGPRWPEEKIQKGYTGTHGVDLLRRSISFIDMIEEDGALIDGWKGLDYGCGWGRMASIMLTKGRPEQLDLCDAWPVTLRIISELGYENRIFPVPELLSAGDIQPESYDLIMSFSVFTHLSPGAFERNIPVLVSALRPGGRFYFTVRHSEFIDHKYADMGQQYRDALSREDIVFLDSGGDVGSSKAFGDTIVNSSYLDRLVGVDNPIRYVGQPHSLQHVYVVEKRL